MVERRLTGSFYTCDNVADYLTAWAIQDESDSVLEPSFGDGVFIDSAIKRFSSLGNSAPKIFAVELQQAPFNKYTENGNVDIKGYCKDFMCFNEDVKVSSVIGNPPYVRLKHLKETDRLAAIAAVEELNVTMLTSGSLWMPFVVHSTKFLKQHGRLGFVLPFELTYVRYAYPLWSFLRSKFGRITVCRIHEDLFPEVDVETILLMAEDYGNSTSNVEYKIFENAHMLFCNSYKKYEQILIDDIINGGKPFIWAHLTEKEKDLFTSLRNEKRLTAISSFCKFKIGYVCADKDFFHPDVKTIEKFKIPPRQLRSCISNAKDINGGTGIGVVINYGQCQTKLYIPSELTDADKKYIKLGVSKDVHNRYKCRIRNPWYITPSIEKADLVLTVFGDVPKLLGNRGDYAVSNSLLSGILNGKASGDGIVCRWYNSLTLLSAELNVHSLGGGVLVFIPGEADKIEIFNTFPKEKEAETIEKLNECVLNEGLSSAYLLGDQIVLKDVFGLSNAEVSTIRTALKELQYWRRPDKRRPKK